MLTAPELGLLLAKRVKLGPEYTLSLQTLIPAALANLARNVAKDPQRRNMLMTDAEIVTADVEQSVLDGRYRANLFNVLTTYQAMIKTLRYGTIWHVPASVGFTSSDVITVTNEIIVTGHSFTTGQRIRFTTTGTLPDNITAGVIYFAIVRDADTIAVAATYQDAIDDAAISFDMSAGTGSSLIHFVDGWQEVQWLQSPTQGTVEPCGPFEFVTAYLIGDKMYLNNVTGGSLRFAVPYLPTLETFPNDENLTQDLLDELVALYLTADPALEKDA